MHIPKCGGTTIDHILVNFPQFCKTLNYRNIHINLFIIKNFFMILIYIKNTFISGHLDFDFTKNSKNIFKCSIVRNPLDRVISHYKYSVFRKNLIPLKYTFEDFLKEEIVLIEII